jgi:DNA-binding response OmpR family regulator
LRASLIASQLIILGTMTRAALIIEDDPTLAGLVQLHLRDADCAADIADDGVTGLAMFKEGNYALVVLDIMLPRKDGLSVCRDIRRLPGYVPILMLTAKSTERDRICGLETGADDYLTKPFSVLELVARVKALLRRVDALSPETASAAENEVIDRGNMRIAIGKRQVTVNDENIALTAKEFDLLTHFARNPGQVFNRVQLLDQVWGYNHEGYEHTVNSHINRLRAKIESDPAKPKYILTVWGVGYKFTE